MHVLNNVESDRRQRCKRKNKPSCTGCTEKIEHTFTIIFWLFGCSCLTFVHTTIDLFTVKSKKKIFLLCNSKCLLSKTCMCKFMDFFTQVPVSDIAKRFEISLTTVYTVKKNQDNGKVVDWCAGSDWTGIKDRRSLRDAIRNNPLTSMGQKASILGAGTATARRAVARLGGKSRVIGKGPVLTSELHA